ncbi:hypothetical protein NQT74_17990 [Alteromonas stellipolaris]|jgi:hypothetical protein|uniref:hypothetical protein n=1 Tax=Alteromonas stellipolaris TaxID=233316 RepID=UPI0021180964|nr:hypothetical protein [Alteromonas stellipolaris]MCQ8850475.1 hypothetical protein [Alteromonas stellipolaris]
MVKEKWYKNPEMIIALTALFIGLLTAFISIYSAYTDRAYAKASVWPKIEISRSHNVDSFSYGVANKGTGPALIKYAKVYSGTKFLKKWSELPEFKNISQSHLNNTTLPSGHSITPLKYKGESVSDILAIDNNIEIELCYCSIYEDCWVVDRTNITQPVNSCSVRTEHAFWQ